MHEIVKEHRDPLNHVLFLDFDGPLFPDRYISYCPENRRPYPGIEKFPGDINYWKMDPMSVEMLNFLHDIFRFTTVVSSTWKRHINKKQCEDLFITNGLNLTLADDWSTVRLDTFGWRNCVRAHEILEYIERHCISEYMILDDPQSGSSLDDRANAVIQDRVVLVNPDTGIDSYDYRKLLKIVKNWAGFVDNPRLWG